MRTFVMAAFLTALASGQPTSTLTFEVASVKPAPVPTLEEFSLDRLAVDPAHRTQDR